MPLLGPAVPGQAATWSCWDQSVSGPGASFLPPQQPHLASLPPLEARPPPGAPPAAGVRGLAWARRLPPPARPLWRPRPFPWGSRETGFDFCGRPGLPPVAGGQRDGDLLWTGCSQVLPGAGQLPCPCRPTLGLLLLVPQLGLPSLLPANGSDLDGVEPGAWRLLCPPPSLRSLDLACSRVRTGTDVAVRRGDWFRALRGHFQLGCSGGPEALSPHRCARKGQPGGSGAHGPRSGGQFSPRREAGPDPPLLRPICGRHSVVSAPRTARPARFSPGGQPSRRLLVAVSLRSSWPPPAHLVGGALSAAVRRGLFPPGWAGLPARSCPG